MSKEAKLNELLVSLFDAGELRRFISYRYSGLSSRLPGQSTSLAQLAFDVVALLHRSGNIDQAFFEALIEERPRRVAEIRASGALWIGQETAPAPSGPPAAPANPVDPAFRYEVFIAHANPDKAVAEELYAAIRRSDAGARVFLDTKSLMLGDSWDVKIPAALRASRVILVLVSERIEQGWYARNEIAEAIELARGPETKQRVVPIFLEGNPGPGSNIPYGLRTVHGICLPEWRVEGVAAQVIALLQQLRAPDPEP